MSRLVPAALGAALIPVVLGVSPALADEEPVTLVGRLACAKCTLEEEGRDACQNVLIVKPEEEGAEADYYYLVDNEVSQEFGEVCMEVVEVTVTGTVEIDEGLAWITPTVIEPVEDPSSGSVG